MATNEKASILAVDDIPFFLSRLKAVLKDTPYKLTCVNSGSAALRFIKANTPSLFLLDIEMPEMDGFELARNLREAGQTAPIIFLTGNSMEEQMEKAAEVGVTDFIIKPIMQDQALEKIAQILN